MAIPTKSRAKLKIEVIDYAKVYPFRVIIVYKKGGNFVDMLKELLPTYPELEAGIKEMDPTIVAFTYSAGTGSIFLFMTDDFSLDVLVHECVHIVAAAFEAIGSYINDETEEFFAYLQEYMFREIYKLMKTKWKLKVRMSF